MSEHPTRNGTIVVSEHEIGRRKMLDLLADCTRDVESQDTVVVIAFRASLNEQPHAEVYLAGAEGDELVFISASVSASLHRLAASIEDVGRTAKLGGQVHN